MLVCMFKQYTTWPYSVDTIPTTLEFTLDDIDLRRAPLKLKRSSAEYDVMMKPLVCCRTKATRCHVSNGIETR